MPFLRALVTFSILLGFPKIFAQENPENNRTINQLGIFMVLERFAGVERTVEISRHIPDATQFDFIDFENMMSFMQIYIGRTGIIRAMEQSPSTLLNARLSQLNVIVEFIAVYLEIKDAAQERPTSTQALSRQEAYNKLENLKTRLNEISTDQLHSLRDIVMLIADTAIEGDLDRVSPFQYNGIHFLSLSIILESVSRAKEEEGNLLSEIIIQKIHSYNLPYLTEAIEEFRSKKKMVENFTCERVLLRRA